MPGASKRLSPPIASYPPSYLVGTLDTYMHSNTANLNRKMSSGYAWPQGQVVLQQYETQPLPETEH
jgi:hypothetical protein